MAAKSTSAFSVRQCEFKFLCCLTTPGLSKDIPHRPVAVCELYILCFQKGDIMAFVPVFKKAKERGLKLALHLAEVGITLTLHIWIVF